MRLIRSRNAKNQSYVDMKLKDLQPGKYLMEDGTYWNVHKNGISFGQPTIEFSHGSGKDWLKSKARFGYYPENITIGEWVKEESWTGFMSVPLKKVSKLPYEEKPSAGPKSKTALRNTIMRDLEPGLYLMEDGTYRYIEFCQKISYDRSGYCGTFIDRGYVGFKEDVAKKAELFGARPQALLDYGEWTNVGALRDTQYERNGHVLGRSIWDRPYWDLETFGHFCEREYGVLPVRKLTEDESKQIKRW